MNIFYVGGRWSQNTTWGKFTNKWFHKNPRVLVILKEENNDGE